MKPAKWFALVYILACAGSLAAALAINVLGNASGLFPSGLFPAMRERPWKTRRLDEMVRDGRAPQVVILGSSRVMGIEPKYVAAITGKRTFNYGVYAATPTDYLAQLRYLLRSGCRPEIVVLGVDENSFRYVHSGEEIEKIGHGGLFGETPAADQVEILATALRSINVASTWTSLLRLVGTQPHAARARSRTEQVILNDGYVIRPEWVRKKQQGSAYSAADILEDHQGRYRQWFEESLLRTNPVKVAHFAEFLIRAKAEGIDLRVMFLPLQPDFERRFDPQFVQAKVALLRNLERICAERGVRYWDFTQLAAYEGDPQEFHDYGHQSAANLRKMMNVVFGIPAGKVRIDLPSDAEILEHLPPGTNVTTE